MSEVAQALLTKALELPREDQQWLTDRLLEETEPDADEEAWHAELARRLEKHPEQLLDGDEVMRELQEMLTAKRRVAS
jgi:hypothetical protein